jgi:AcrR family transcriptional regulator
MNETKLRILDAAERLLADHGMDVSLRTITAEAGVNLAAVNYHFQSKDALIDEIIARRFEPMNAHRIQMLDALEAEYPSGPLPLEAVLEAFLKPVLTFTEADADHFRPLLGRCFSLPEEFLHRVFERHLASILERFNHAFARAVPGLPEQDRLWRIMFSIGAIVHVMSWTKLLPIISHGSLDPTDTAALTRRIVAFAAAGFRAEIAHTGGHPDETDLRCTSSRRKFVRSRTAH